MLAKQTWYGIAAALLAGALWGLVFLAPELTRGFTPLELSAGRYLAYGLVASMLIVPQWRRLAATLSWAHWRALIWLSLAGNIIYYLFLAAAVQQGGVAMASIVIGILPIAVTVVGSLEKHAVPFARLVPSLVLTGAGLLCISWQSLAAPGHGSVTGLGCAIGALVSWTCYAVWNSRWLGRLRSVTPHEWSLLMGVVTGIEALVLAAWAFPSMPEAHTGRQLLGFGAVVVSVAVLCSVIGNGLWNYASRALPLTLIGQMIVFESLFAALYGFLWEQRWPTVAEGAAMVLLVAGVVSCAAAHAPRPGTSLATSS